MQIFLSKWTERYEPYGSGPLHLLRAKSDRAVIGQSIDRGWVLARDGTFFLNFFFEKNLFNKNLKIF